MPGGGGGDTTTTVEGWGPAMDAVKADLLPGIENYASNYGSGEGLWEGSILAPESALEQEGQQSILDMLPQLEAQYAGLTDSLEGFLDYDPNSAKNVARRNALEANINASFNNTIRPGIEDRYTSYGQFGGPQQMVALGAATEPLSRAIADSEVDIMRSDEQNALMALGMAPSIFSSSLDPARMRMSLGEGDTARAQAELMDEIQMFEAGRNNDYRSLAELQQLLVPLAGMSQRTTQPGSDGGILQGAVGGALTGLATGDPYMVAAGAGIGALGSL